VEVELNMFGALVLYELGGVRISDYNTLMNEVEVELNMLGALVLYKLGGEVDCVDEWHVTGGCVAPRAADGASTPLLHRWL
jgi:hypothetical protein